MIDSRLSTLAWAVGLSLGGVLILLFNFDVLTQFEPGAQYLLSAVLGGIGITFFGAYASTKKNWWRLIPAWTLFALATMIIGSTFPGFASSVIAALLFVGLSLAFFHIYTINRADHWWAIIPGGFMLVLAIVIAISSFISQAETLGAILFAGMGAVFFGLYILGSTQQHWWALIPGSGLVVFGIFVFVLDAFGAESEGGIFRWWPILLILLGAILGLRAFRRPPPSEKFMVNTAPSPARSMHQQKSQTKSTQQISTANRTRQIRSAPGTSIEILPDPDDGR
ncbi:hypothetical protein KFU94_05425 [Chloroflexi bacterium TSY]|nr:hypothetical protein [Chloroflexi bacterium TSY]